MVDEDEQNPYTILGVSPRTPWPQIRERFRALVKECHPDLGADASRSDRFLRVVAAYRTLEQVQEPNPAPEEEAEPKVRTGPQGRTAELIAASQERLLQGWFKAAETLGRLAIKDDPKSPDAYVAVARALVRQHLFAEANGCLRLALHFDPHHKPATLELQALERRDRSLD